MAATVPGASTLGLSEEKKASFNKVLGLLPEQHSKELYAIFKADKLSRFYVPAVMMGHDSPPPPSSRTVHILGNDQKSKFLSHALHGVYDAVNMVDMPPNTRYTNVTGNVGSSRRRDGIWIENNQSIKEGPESKDENGHISNLVVGGRPAEAVKLLEKVKHRVDDRTAICYMQDGLGIAENINNKIFTDAAKRPSIVLGHMGSLAYNRETNSVRVMDPEFTTALTGVRPATYDPSKDIASDTWLRTQGMLGKFAASDVLNAQGVYLEKWMMVKIPSLMFSAAVEPICVMLDAHYKDILYNPTAHRLIQQLLVEISDVVGLMSETRKAPGLQRLLRGDALMKQMMGKLRGKKDSPSRMSLQIQRGLLTDIEYLNGYFITRGRRKGLDMPANQLVMDMVKAKHKSVLEKHRSYIPMEVTSRRQT
ncbi:hypothetical protein CkaCkLH20_10339 [Colletotrichum karsti]|uniref:2-dehydropantoate 2-reductase n=1 Tax=Colletotrichum karsti TaxID=1095194 RepID=A0A9P6HW10_9PEZI|nr:uncharacterized protein CkaCkLH20_10339 [Colletotrichum karsti]KAF9872247.1 hypothetical protein CkaCkLH20_10339 [Colletotrichum karsti]